MNGSELTQVVDSVAEKVGMAAEKLAPIAEEVVRQVQARALLYSVSCAVLAIVLWLATAAIAKAKTDDDKKPAQLCLGLASALSAIMVTGFALEHFGDYIAPLPYLLGR